MSCAPKRHEVVPYMNSMVEVEYFIYLVQLSVTLSVGVMICHKEHGNFSRSFHYYLRYASNFDLIIVRPQTCAWHHGTNQCGNYQPREPALVYLFILLCFDNQVIAIFRRTLPYMQTSPLRWYARVVMLSAVMPWSDLLTHILTISGIYQQDHSPSISVGRKC